MESIKELRKEQNKKLELEHLTDARLHKLAKLQEIHLNKFKKFTTIIHEIKQFPCFNTLLFAQWYTIPQLEEMIVKPPQPHHECTCCPTLCKCPYGQPMDNFNAVVQKALKFKKEKELEKRQLEEYRRLREKKLDSTAKPSWAFD